MTTCRLHWRDLHTGDKGQCATPVPDAELAHRIIGSMNRTQKGCFHWHFKHEAKQPAVAAEAAAYLGLAVQP